MVKSESQKEASLHFISGTTAKKISYVGTDRFGRTPADMREKANKEKLKLGIVEFKPPKPKGEPPKFQQRTGRLDFKYEC